MNLNQLLTQINQTTPKSDVKNLHKPRFNYDNVAKFFIQDLNTSILKATSNEKSLIINEQNKNVIELLIQYICFNPLFKASNDSYSFRKGILLMGNFGSGKTELMKSYKNALVKGGVKVGMVTTTDVTNKYSEYNESNKRIMGLDGLKPYLDPFDKTERIFDDFGAEDFLNDYGNKKSVMIEILERRYNNRLNGLKTHLTTNLQPDEIKVKYGERIYSRMREMFNVVVLGGGNDSIDFRK